MTAPRHLRGATVHSRKGAVANSFRYRVNYVLVEDGPCAGPALFSRNRGNLTALHDRDHGGPPQQGRGAVWVREVLAAQGLPGAEQIALLAQPRVLGHVFNPVSFWLCRDIAGALRVVIAEVTNTFGDRHCYLCHRDDLAPLTRDDRLLAKKLLHVSPFQPVAGGYAFRFDISDDRIGIWIDFSAGQGGLIATLAGPLRPLTSLGILGACLRRPFGSRRVLALIHWQALKLWIKGQRYHRRPQPPVDEVTR